LSENSLLRLILPVPESSVPTVHLGQQVEVQVPTLHRSFPGKVARFADKVSLTTRTMDTEVDVPNPSLVLIPGMYAEVNLTLDRHSAVLAVPVIAVDMDQDSSANSGNATTGKVMVVTPNNRVEIRKIAVGLETPDKIEVRSGLNEGDMVVLSVSKLNATADQALRARALHPLAAYVKARLLNDGGDAELAYELLEKATEGDCKEIKTLRLLGRLQFENKKFAQAARTFERCRELDPLDPSWLPELAKIYTQSGADDKLIGVLKDAVLLDPDDLPMRRKLAGLCKAKGDSAGAEKYARQGLEIDVLDRDCQEILLNALAAQNKDAEVRALRKLLE